MIDTHCHLDAARFDPDRDQVLERAWTAGLHGILVPGVGPDNWEPLLALSRAEPRLQVGLGIHPQLLPGLPPEQDEEHLERLDSLLALKGAIAVGECGLDGPSAAGAPLERQVAVLRRHLELARKHGLPVLMHCFRAHPALIELFKEGPLPEAGVLMHSYGGGADLARFYLQKGCHFSFAGPVTWAEARQPLDALRVIPPSGSWPRRMPRTRRPPRIGASARSRATCPGSSRAWHGCSASRWRCSPSGRPRMPAACSGKPFPRPRGSRPVAL